MTENKEECRYKYEGEFTQWKCRYERLEDSKEGFCIFHERRKDKDKEKFDQGILQILFDKNGPDIYHFEGFYFPDSVSFKGLEFRKNISFCEAVFLGENTDFSEAKFLAENNNFSKVKFLADKTDFSGAEFSGTTYFTSAQFIGKQVTFLIPTFSKNTKCISFGGTVFEAKTSFTRLDLRRCFLFLVDLKNVEFILDEWDWKYRLYNEIESTGPRPLFYLATSEIYRQLKVKLKDEGDFAKAGMFHFREQECKRKAFKRTFGNFFKLRFFLNFFQWFFSRNFYNWFFLWILRLSCGYGEKLRNVVGSSLILVAIFGIVYMFLGLYTADQNASLIIQYKIALKNTAPILTIVKDFCTSVSFTIKGFFPFREFQQYKVVGDFANLVSGF